MSLPLWNFLWHFEEKALQWLASDSFSHDMQDFVHVASAYISMYEKGEMPENLLESLEKTVQVNALNIDANQAI